MIVNKIYCDLCSREMEEDGYIVVIQDSRLLGPEMIQKEITYDICDTCYVDFEKWMIKKIFPSKEGIT